MIVAVWITADVFYVNGARHDGHYGVVRAIRRERRRLRMARKRRRGWS